MKKKHRAILRKREAEVATRLSPSWNGPARKTVLSSDGISYEVSEEIRAVSYGGLGLLQQVVKWSGLAKTIDQGVKLFKRHQPYHESDHVLSLIYNVATGGTRYQDIEMGVTVSASWRRWEPRRFPLPARREILCAAFKRRTWWI